MINQSLQPNINWFTGEATLFPNLAIHQLFEHNVEQFPENIAIVSPDERMSYQELNQKANQLAHWLRHYSLPCETPIALLLSPGPDLIVSILAILKIGCAYLPLDHEQSFERNSLIIKDSKAKLLITYKNLMNGHEITSILPVFLDASKDFLKDQPEINLNLEITSNALATIYYTSGSTDLPKGVLIEHKGLVRLVKNTNYISINQGDRFAQVINITFDIVAFEIWGALLNSASLVYLGASISKDPEKCKELIKKLHVSIMTLPASLFDFLFLSYPDFFSTLKYLILGGEPLNPHTLSQLMKLKNHRPQFVLNGYGPTENSGLTTTFLIPENIDENLPIPIGKPIANTSVYILDENQQLTNMGEVGELYAGGDGVARGYLNRDDLNRQRFIANPFSKNPSNKLYRTGDLASWGTDGNLNFIGRIDSQVKIRGFRIELRAIENHLLNYPGIKQCRVLAVSRTHSDKYLCAFIIPTQETMDLASIKLFLSRFLPKYSIPERYIFLDKLPLTFNGKIDQQTLLNLGASEQLSQTPNTTKESVEEKLAAVWAEVLHLPLPIDYSQDFFSLGGHSLLVLELQQKIKSKLGCKLPWEVFLPATTIMRQAEYIKQHQTSEVSAHAIALQTVGSNPPLFLLPPVGGNYSCFISLARYLNDQPLFVLTDPNETHPEKMVQHFVQIIKSFSHHSGRFRLLGYSYGAHLAVAIANQLIIEGEKVEFLGLIDGWAKLSAEYVSKISFEKRMSSLQKKLSDELVPVNIAWSRMQNLLQEPLKPLSCPMILFKAEDNKDFEEIDDPFNHWQLLAMQGIQRMIVPGTHETLFDEPNVKELAALLQNVIYAKR